MLRARYPERVLLVRQPGPRYARSRAWRVFRGIISLTLLAGLLSVLPAGLCSSCEDEDLQCRRIDLVAQCIASYDTLQVDSPNFCSSSHDVCGDLQRACVPTFMGGPDGPHSVTFHMPYLDEGYPYPLSRLVVELRGGRGAVTALFDGQDTGCTKTSMPDPDEYGWSLVCDLPADVIDIELTVESDAPIWMKIEARPPGGCHYTAEVCGL
jgi:hypothetical protein